MAELLTLPGYAEILEAAGDNASSTDDGSPIATGISMGDIMVTLGIERTVARMMVRHLLGCRGLYQSGQSHAVRYFVSKPKYHGTDGLRAALLEYAKKTKKMGFTRAQFLAEFPFAKSTVYQIVSTMIAEKPPLLARRGNTNNMRYYLPKYAPKVARKRKETP